MTKAEIDRSIRRLMKRERQFQQLADSMENRMLNAMHKAQLKIYRRMSEILATMPSAKAASRNEIFAWYAAQQSEIRRAFNESGYLQAAGEYINDYGRLADIAAEMMVAGGIDPALSIFPKDIIAALQQRDRLFFTELNTSAMQYLDRTFVETVIAAESKYGLLPKLKSVITGDYKWGTRRGLYEWHAGTYARTLHRRFARSMIASKAAENGLENFLYAGPNDGAIRPFCSHIVMQVFTRAEIESMDNGQTGDVMMDGGGYSCRHNFYPISDDLARSIREQYDGDAGESPAAPEPTPPPGSAVPRFQSKKEAEQWIADNLIAGGKNTAAPNSMQSQIAQFVLKGKTVNLRGVPLDAIQAMTDELYAMMQRNGLPPLAGITPNGGQTTWASIRHWGYGGNNPASVANLAARNKQYLKAIKWDSDTYALKCGMDNNWWAARNASDLAFHESVHYWQSFATPEIDLKIKTIYLNAGKYSKSVSGSNKWIHNTISQYADYAGTNSRVAHWEFLAESMVKIRRDGTGWIPNEFRDELIEIAEKIGGW